MDERARYFRRLRKLRGSARRWSVLGGGLTAATAVLTPYAGIGIADAAWAASAGASVALAWWRWNDHRELAAIPAPPAPARGRRASAWSPRSSGSRPAAGAPGGAPPEGPLRAARLGGRSGLGPPRPGRRPTLVGLAGPADRPGRGSGARGGGGRAVAARPRPAGRQRRTGPAARARPTSGPALEQAHGSWPVSSPRASRPTSGWSRRRPVTSPRTAARSTATSTRALTSLLEATDRLRGVADGLSARRQLAAEPARTPPARDLGESRSLTAPAGSGGTSR